MNKIFKDNEMSIKAHNVSREFYGMAGEVFINKLIDTYSENDYKEIVEKNAQIQSKLREIIDEEIVSTYIQSISIIVVADILMNSFFNFGFDEESSISLGVKMLNQLETEKEIDEIERAKEIVESWLIQNDSKFDRQSLTEEYDSFENTNNIIEKVENDNKVIEKFGMYKDDVYYILPTVFNSLINQYGMSPNKIRKGFARRGYILADENTNRNLVCKYYNGGTRRMVGFKLENRPKRQKGEINEKIEDKSAFQQFNYKMEDLTDRNIGDLENNCLIEELRARQKEIGDVIDGLERI